MRQITVKRAVEALYWIHNNAHHIVGIEEHPTKKDENGRPLETHIYLKNHHETLRIPDSLRFEVWKHIQPNKRPFDTRMYALTATGKRLVTR